MIYIKAKPNYGIQPLSERLVQIVNNCALNPPIWERNEDGTFKFPYGYELIGPGHLFELLPGEWVFLRIYKSEDLSPLHEDKILFNEKTGAAVPNAALWSVEEVIIESDLCTDALQEHLKAGWHILAICPQPQRRPDYILGKSPQMKPQRLEIPKSRPTPVSRLIDDEIPF